MSDAEAYFTSKMANPDFRAAYKDSQELSRIVTALAKARKAKGLTQKQVAKRLKIKQPSVSEFETEQKDPRVWTVQRYARAIGMRIRLTLEEVEDISDGAALPAAEESEWLERQPTSSQCDSEGLRAALQAVRELHYDLNGWPSKGPGNPVCAEVERLRGELARGQALENYGELAEVIESLPGLLRKAREKRRLTYRTAGAELEISTSVLHRIEHGGVYTSEILCRVLRWLSGGAS
jgi:transcriptional regulator with XRE-family HTH domain